MEDASFNLPYPGVAIVCDGNIGMCSSSCYDACAVGLSSLLLCPTLLPDGLHHDWFVDLVDEGYAVKSSVDKELIREWVFGCKKLNPRMANLLDENSWEHSVEWMLEKSGLSTQKT